MKNQKFEFGITFKKAAFFLAFSLLMAVSFSHVGNIVLGSDDNNSCRLMSCGDWIKLYAYLFYVLSIIFILQLAIKCFIPNNRYLIISDNFVYIPRRLFHKEQKLFFSDINSIKIRSVRIKLSVQKSIILDTGRRSYELAAILFKTRQDFEKAFSLISKKVN